MRNANPDLEPTLTLQNPKTQDRSVNKQTGRKHGRTYKKTGNRAIKDKRWNIKTIRGRAEMELEGVFQPNGTGTYNI